MMLRRMPSVWHLYQPATPKPAWALCYRDNKRSAQVSCPSGHVSSLGDHSIGDGGLVEPSVVCAVEGCDFHEMVVLVDW